MRIAQYLHHAYKLPDHDFISELFRQLLAREPRQDEVDYHLGLLASGLSRNDLIIGMMDCHEAQALYKHPVGAEGAFPTAADKMKLLLTLNHEEFVRQLYAELFCREPEPRGLEGHVNTLRHGVDYMSVMRQFLTSGEWHSLMESTRHEISRKILAHFLSML